MQMIEQRFSGRDANLTKIKRAIDRQLARGKLRRVEVRYSPEATQTMHEDQAKAAIVDLLLEHGMQGAEVSVRQHEGALDIASGEHVLRLYPRVVAGPNAGAGAGAGAGAAAAAGDLAGFRGWLARWFPAWFAVPLGQAQGAPAPVPAPAPQVSKPQAVALLRQAVAKSVLFRQSESGSLLVGQTTDRGPVSAAQVLVRDAALHAVLLPLLPSGAASTADAVAAMLGQNGLKVGPGFRVSYDYRAPGQASKTTYAGQADLEVKLMFHTPAAVRPDPVVDEYDNMTAIPLRQVIPSRARVALEVLVLGTWQNGATQAFANPVALQYSSFPARFDRHALMNSRLAQEHPALLAVASNSRPLLIDQDGPDALVLHTPGGADMYRRLPSLQALHEAEPLNPHNAMLLVNDPGGVHRPDQQQTLPALVIQLRAKLG